MTRYILVVGSTGQGKSALCNVLSNSTVFQEGVLSVSTTKSCQSASFTADGHSYAIIDTVGLGDTKMDERLVLNKLRDSLVDVGAQGIYQVLFVFNGKLTEWQIKSYHLLTTVLFQSSVRQYVTLVRTHFGPYQDVQQCVADRHALVQQGTVTATAEIITSSHALIHVNNPSEHDDGYETNRVNSRTILLAHLSKCSSSSSYVIDDPGTTTSRIAAYKTEAEQIEEQRQATARAEEALAAEQRRAAELHAQAVVRSTLMEGQTLATDVPLESADGQYRAVLQSDSNFVVYRVNPWKAVWASDTYHRGNPRHLVMQQDRNLVIYNHGGFPWGGSPYWASNTCGHGVPGCSVRLHDDGILRLTDGHGTQLWQSCFNK